jgi:hypothetical protein
MEKQQYATLGTLENIRGPSTNLFQILCERAPRSMSDMCYHARERHLASFR